MMSVTRRTLAATPLARIVLIVSSVFAMALGCDKAPSSTERMSKAREEAHIASVSVYPLAGRVTVDNQSPSMKSKKAALVVMAYDASKPNASTDEQPFVIAREDGSFEFADGGLPAGKYVMLFAEVDRKSKKKKKNEQLGDLLKNLYNDPDVNGKKPEFTITHAAPGKTDYAFELSVAGQTPPLQPGPKALTHIRQ